MISNTIRNTVLLRLCVLLARRMPAGREPWAAEGEPGQGAGVEGRTPCSRGGVRVRHESKKDTGIFAARAVTDQEAAASTPDPVENTAAHELP